VRSPFDVNTREQMHSTTPGAITGEDARVTGRLVNL